MTFCATANCVLYQGATPSVRRRIADTLNLDPGEVAKKLSSRTKAILRGRLCRDILRLLMSCLRTWRSVVTTRSD